MDVNAIESAWGSGVKHSSCGSAFVAKFENRLPAALHLSHSGGERRCLIVVANSRSRRRPRPSCSELNRLHTDEGRQLTSVSMRIETTEQLDVAPLIEVPV